MLQSMQRRIKGALLDLQSLAGNLFDSEQDPIAVLRA